MTTTDLPTATELEKFYADIITTAVEGGNARFAQIETWGRHIWEHPHTTVATVVAIDVDGGDGSDMLPDGVELPVAIGIKEIAHAFERMNDPRIDDTVAEFGINAQYVGDYLRARRARDAGEIDAYDAAAIFQVALFGKAHLG